MRFRSVGVMLSAVILSATAAPCLEAQQPGAPVGIGAAIGYRPATTIHHPDAGLCTGDCPREELGGGWSYAASIDFALSQGWRVGGSAAYSPWEWDEPNVVQERPRGSFVQVQADVHRRLPVGTTAPLWVRAGVGALTRRYEAGATGWSDSDATHPYLHGAAVLVFAAPWSAAEFRGVLEDAYVLWRSVDRSAPDGTHLLAARLAFVWRI